MSRILTGIQSTGVPHLGNILGAIIPGIELANQPENEAFFFIADLHTMTTIHNPELLRSNTYSVAAAWLAFGFDTNTGCFYRQSDIPEVTELTWYLSCMMPYSRLQLAHSFKDKSDNLKNVSAGLFTYPMLMAADILMYDANIVPVGKDQKQHLEFTRVVAEKMNRNYGEMLIVPEPLITENVAVVPGTTKDSEGNFTKMSKSYGNTINIFEDDKKLRKAINKIQTEPKDMGEPLDPETDIVYTLFEMIAGKEAAAPMRQDYLEGKIGYGQAKGMLFELITEKFGEARRSYSYYMENLPEIDAKLTEGAEKAGVIAYEVLARVRDKIGFKKFAY